MKVLNLYAGIGGNRNLWPKECKVTAIENNKEIATIYKDFFFDDMVIIADAHKYLLEHYKEFDFIWSSPPCPSHSKLRKGFSVNVGASAIYPDMRLYQEILFLEGYFEGKWVVENVISWYNPLIRPYEVSRHYFWSCDIIHNINIFDGKFSITDGDNEETGEEQTIRLGEEFGFNLLPYNISKTIKRTLIRNCVHPKLGLHIFNCAFKEKQETLQQ